MKAKEFGAYLRSLRKMKKLSTREVENICGVSNSYLSLIETGKRGIPSPDILKKLSNALGVSYPELMEKAAYVQEEDGLWQSVGESVSSVDREIVEKWNEIGAKNIILTAELIERGMSQDELEQLLLMMLRLQDNKKQ